MTDKKRNLEAFCAPLLIGPGNALAVTGTEWRWIRDQAERLGLPLLGTRRKRVVNAAAFLAALEAERARPDSDPNKLRIDEPEPTNPTPAEARAWVLRRLGKKWATP